MCNGPVAAVTPKQIAAEHSYLPSTAVVVVGGDGTVREFAARSFMRGPTPLVVAPAGTGNSSCFGLWDDQRRGQYGSPTAAPTHGTYGQRNSLRRQPPA